MCSGAKASRLEWQPQVSFVQRPKLDNDSQCANRVYLTEKRLVFNLYICRSVKGYDKFDLSKDDY